MKSNQQDSHNVKIVTIHLFQQPKVTFQNILIMPTPLMDPFQLTKIPKNRIKNIQFILDPIVKSGN